MKILAISDIHSAPEKVYSYLDGNVVDYIIVIGDVTEFGPEDLFIDTLNKFSEYAPVYAIFGLYFAGNALLTFFVILR